MMEPVSGCTAASFSFRLPQHCVILEVDVADCCLERVGCGFTPTDDRLARKNRDRPLYLCLCGEQRRWVTGGEHLGEPSCDVD